MPHSRLFSSSLHSATQYLLTKDSSVLQDKDLFLHLEPKDPSKGRDINKKGAKGGMRRKKRGTVKIDSSNMAYRDRINEHRRQDLHSGCWSQRNVFRKPSSREGNVRRVTTFNQSRMGTFFYCLLEAGCYRARDLLGSSVFNTGVRCWMNGYIIHPKELGACQTAQACIFFFPFLVKERQKRPTNESEWWRREGCPADWKEPLSFKQKRKRNKERKEKLLTIWKPTIRRAMSGLLTIVVVKGQRESVPGIFRKVENQMASPLQQV